MTEIGTQSIHRYTHIGPCADIHYMSYQFMLLLLLSACVYVCMCVCVCVCVLCVCYRLLYMGQGSNMYMHMSVLNPTSNFMYIRHKGNSYWSRSQQVNHWIHKTFQFVQSSSVVTL